MVEVGSMEVVGVYKDAGIHRGLQQTQKDLEQTEQHSKSLATEMKRMKGLTFLAATAAAALGLAFLGALSSAISSSPYLIGAITRIKTDIQLLWWQITKYLKPAFDILADAIHALRKGDWQGFKDAMVDAWNLAIDTMKTVWNWVKDNSPEWLVNIMNWLEDTYDTIVNYEWQGVWQALEDSINWVWNNIILELLPNWLSDFMEGVSNWAGSSEGVINKAFSAIVEAVQWNNLGIEMAKDFWDGFSSWTSIRNPDGSFKIAGDSPGSGSWAVGTAIVPSDGMYKLHAGESITPSNSNQASPQQSSIVLDFSGANINLANGIDLDKFADVVSRKIADTQAWGAY